MRIIFFMLAFMLSIVFTHADPTIVEANESIKTTSTQITTDKENKIADKSDPSLSKESKSNWFGIIFFKIIPIILGVLLIAGLFLFFSRKIKELEGKNEKSINTLADKLKYSKDSSIKQLELKMKDLKQSVKDLEQSVKDLEQSNITGIFTEQQVNKELSESSVEAFNTGILPNIDFTPSSSTPLPKSLLIEPEEKEKIFLESLIDFLREAMKTGKVQDFNEQLQKWKYNDEISKTSLRNAMMETVLDDFKVVMLILNKPIIHGCYQGLDTFLTIRSGTRLTSNLDTYFTDENGQTLSIDYKVDEVLQFAGLLKNSNDENTKIQKGKIRLKD